MNAQQKRKDQLEVSSDQLKSELIEIKERVGALETIASISNRGVVETYVRSEIKTEKARQIMALCTEPQTREQLKTKLGLASTQALDHHLRPLKEADLIRQRFDDDGNLTLEWSNLFRRLPVGILKKILADPAEKTRVKTKEKHRPEGAQEP